MTDDDAVLIYYCEFIEIYDPKISGKQRATRNSTLSVWISIAADDALARSLFAAFLERTFRPHSADTTCVLSRAVGP